jgi:Ca2+-transporting ATPase
VPLLTGLSESEAARRLERDGPNELPSPEVKGPGRTLLGMLREPMLLLLVVAGAIYFALGDLREALVLCAAMSVVLAITFVQERKTERALAALRHLTSPRARVIRDGGERRIPARELVIGDLVLLAEGDRVPADGPLLAAAALEIDESLLTGESAPVAKREGGSEAPRAASGTLVVRGHGTMEVDATGPRTELGRIGRVLADLSVERTPLQRQIGRLVIAMAGLGAAACVMVAGGLWLRGADGFDAALAGIALAMGLLPEELPVVLAVFFALGAVRLSRQRVLTRRLPTLETLGSTTVLCADKTGTLTENRMSITRLEAPRHAAEVDPDGPLPEELHDLVEVGILASQRDPFDPMERAFRALGERALGGTEHLHDDWVLEREYPLSPELLAMSHVWSAPGRSRLVIAAKGAPEAVADLCHLPREALADVEARTARLAAEGLRVLAVARAYFVEPLPARQHDFPFEWLGLVGLADPLRPGAAAAVASCREAGIRVVMITGDHAETAGAIARELGLPGTLVVGSAVRGTDDADLSGVGVVARASPTDKLAIVGALRRSGAIVAMTGDGVNDAPALKAAHVGIAMGGHGTDVAREAAAVVVTDDDFSSIVAGIRTGRRIQDNLAKAIAYVLSVHVAIAGIALLPVLLDWPLVLLPVHIAFLELIIDPASSLAFEAEPADDDVMRRPPRPSDRPLVGRREVAIAIAQGAGILLATAAVLAWSVKAGLSDASARAATFSALIAANVGLLAVDRSWSESAWRALARGNRPLWLVCAGAALFLGATLYLPWLRDLFGFGPVAGPVLAGALGTGMAGVAWFELYKWIAVRLRRRARG